MPRLTFVLATTATSLLVLPLLAIAGLGDSTPTACASSTATAPLTPSASAPPTPNGSTTSTESAPVSTTTIAAAITTTARAADPTVSWDTEHLGPEQVAYGNVIIYVGLLKGLPVRAEIIAVATALQESGLRNIPARQGDRDSVGLFQQRPSQGWGTAQQLMDPEYAASAFYRALVRVPHWQALPLAVAAQTVQRSAAPGAYAKWEPLATALVSSSSAANLSAPTCPDSAGQAGPPGSAAAIAISYAQAQLGLPYQWGGDGPQAGDLGFDCSGLTHAAYEAAGIQIPRTAQTQYNAGPRLPPDQAPQPGDLVFYGTSPTHITHVGLIVTPATMMIDAPRTGAQIRQESIWTSSLIGYSRPST